MSGADRKPMPGLRSPRDSVDGLVYFGRMVDKLRLEQSGKLPKDYRENLGKGFDQACCDFLGVPYEKIRERVGEGGTDEEILKWCGKPFAKTKSTIRACCSISPPTIDLHKQVKVLASCIADAKISSEC